MDVQINEKYKLNVYDILLLVFFIIVFSLSIFGIVELHNTNLKLIAIVCCFSLTISSVMMLMFPLSVYAMNKATMNTTGDMPDSELNKMPLRERLKHVKLPKKDILEKTVDTCEKIINKLGGKNNDKK